MHLNNLIRIWFSLCQNWPEHWKRRRFVYKRKPDATHIGNGNSYLLCELYRCVFRSKYGNSTFIVVKLIATCIGKSSGNDEEMIYCCNNHNMQHAIECHTYELSESTIAQILQEIIFEKFNLISKCISSDGNSQRVKSKSLHSAHAHTHTVESLISASRKPFDLCVTMCKIFMMNLSRQFHLIGTRKMK